MTSKARENPEAVSSPPASLDSEVLQSFLSPSCRMSLERLKDLGVEVSYLPDQNGGKFWRLTVGPNGTHRVYFPTWLNELLSHVQLNAVQEAAARLRNDFGL